MWLIESSKSTDNSPTTCIRDFICQIFSAFTTCISVRLDDRSRNIIREKREYWLIRFVFWTRHDQKRIDGRLLQNSRRRSCCSTRTRTAPSRWRSSAWSCDLWGKGRPVSGKWFGKKSESVGRVSSTCAEAGMIWPEATSWRKSTRSRPKDITVI